MSKSSEIWTNILNTLKTQVPKSSFEAWLKNTSGQLHNDTLTIYTDQTYALDWLENRLRLTIERTAQSVAQRPLTITFQLTQDDKKVSQPDLFMSGSYRDSYNETVKPNQVFVGTQYFRQAWLPLLGPTLWVIILEMRQRCYWNKNTGEKRDTFEATYNQLAAATGLSRKTVFNGLNPTDEPTKSYINLFIPDRQILRQYSKYRNILVTKSMMWTIRLDDPLTPEDEYKLTKSSECKNDT